MSESTNERTINLRPSNTDDEWLLADTEDQVHRALKWSRYQYKNLIKSGLAMPVPYEEEQERLPGLEAFYRELFQRLYSSDNPLENPELPKQSHWARVAHDAAQSVRQWEPLISRTRGDKVFAGMAASVIAEQVLRNIPAPNDNMDLGKAADEIDDAKDALSEYSGNDPGELEQLETGVRCAMHKADRIDKELDEFNASIDESALRTAIRSAANDAEEKIDEEQKLAEVMGWGDSSGQITKVSAQERIALAKRVMDDHKFAEIMNLAGRFIRIDGTKRATKARASTAEIDDVELGAEFRRLLPHQYAWANKKELKALFMSKYVEKQLLQWSLKDRETLGKGPIIACVDVSGSMDGHREIWSKAMAFALMHKAVSQNRPFAAVLFDGEVQLTRFVVKGDSQQAKMNSMLDIVRTFSGGGTSWERPLISSMEILSRGQYSDREQETTDRPNEFKRADIIFITDGECDIDEDCETLWRQFREQHEVTCYGVLIGASSGWEQTIDKLADKTWKGTLNNDSGALDLVLGE